jgi:hypothetical protein
MFYTLLSLLVMIQVSWGDGLTPFNESYALSQVDFARGEISASDYQMGVAAATIGAAGSALPTHGVTHKPLSFSFKTKLTDAARRMEQAFEQMVQRRSQKPVFVYAKHDKSALPRRSSSADALHDHSWFFENRGDGSTNPKNRATFETLKREYRARMEKPIVSDLELANIVNDLYRENAKIGSGSTAAAIREEITTGIKVGGKSHIQKGKEYVVFLDGWLKRKIDASVGDVTIAENILKDLKDALGVKI